MASVFSGSSGRKAAVVTGEQAQLQLQQLQELYNASSGQARGELASGFDAARNAYNQGYGQQRQDLQGGLDQSTATLQGGLAQGTNTLNNAYGQALQGLDQRYGQGAQTLQGAADAFNPLIDKGMQGYDMYMNALGLNGGTGNQAATDAFQAGPGYQWNVDQATGQAQRAANKLGMAYSGNTVDATTRLASNLANQEYGKWVGNLQGFQGASQNAVAGQAGVMGNLANLYQNQGNQTAALNQSQGRDVSGLQSQIAGLIANNQMGTGQNLSNAAGNAAANMGNLESAAGQSQAGITLGNAQNNAGAISNMWSTIIPASQQGMMAGQQAAANRFGAVMGGVNAAASIIGGAGGLSGVGSMIGNLFK